MNSAPADSSSNSAPSPVKLGLCVGALGVVFGDIGTSPLYTMKECLATLSANERHEGVLGILSLIFWALILVVCVKYIWFILRADNRGEGGIFALMALAHVKETDDRKVGRRIGTSLLVMLFGAALLYGDSVITPAITVLSASEGLKGVHSFFETPEAHRYIIMIACVILAAIFWVQHKGTKLIGDIFGPVMMIWFGVIGALGLWHIWQAPEIFQALNPLHGIRLITSHPSGAATLLGSVVLAVTGAEAIYADMGHFGRKAIARAWFWFAFPGLLLNYFGQGAYVLSHSDDVTNPFFEMVPAGWPQGALTLLSIAAAIIASQAVISGAFSLTRSAIQLGYFPRLRVTHTSAEQAGQIYVPLINMSLALLAIGVVISFGSSERLAAAYGIAVTGTMIVTTYAFYLVTLRHWHWPKWKALSLCGVFVVIDTALFPGVSGTGAVEKIAADCPSPPDVPARRLVEVPTTMFPVSIIAYHFAPLNVQTGVPANALKLVSKIIENNPK